MTKKLQILTISNCFLYSRFSFPSLIVIRLFKAKKVEEGDSSSSSLNESCREMKYESWCVGFVESRYSLLDHSFSLLCECMILSSSQLDFNLLPDCFSIFSSSVQDFYPTFSSFYGHLPFAVSVLSLSLEQGNKYGERVL